MICYQYWISGRVQGVYFRAFTESIARRLGICGWVRNLQDARVEVLACGEPAALEAFEASLHQGPPRAKVDQVEKKEAFNVDCPNGFRIIE
jgi:acylphosphatase